MQSESSQGSQQGDKPLGRSLFQGAMRRLAGTQSEGAPNVKVIRSDIALLQCMLWSRSDRLT